jgi:acyl dehydratase
MNTPLGTPRYDSLQVGDHLPTLTMPAITRHALAVYCGASGDHNPVHVDIDFARASGLDDVIAHGMLVMSYTGRVITDWVPQSAIRALDTRFKAVTRIGDELTVRAEVIEKREEDDGRRLVRMALEARDQHGEVKTAGHALVELP